MYNIDDVEGVGSGMHTVTLCYRVFRFILERKMSEQP
jgi:hypothetical protein